MYVYVAGCCDCRLRGQFAGANPFPPTHAMAWLLNPAAAACGTAEKEGQAKAAECLQLGVAAA